MKKWVLLIMTVSLLFASECKEVKEVLKQDFESTKIGDIPEGWMMGATGQKSLGIWEVVEGKSVYMRYPRGSSGEQFNLLYTKDVYFLNGAIEAKIKADKGRENQGGAIIWRMRDRKNYYMAMIDPLNKEFMIKVLKNGESKKIYSKKIDLKDGWQRLRVVFCFDLIEVFLNGKKIADIKDSTITHSGGAGILTKADAKTFFDEIEIKVFK